MTEGRRDARTLGALMALGIANHVVLAGSRITVSLDALSLGATPFTVGALMALYALLPSILGIAAGRMADRIGTIRPMRAGSVGLLIGAALPAMLPGMPILFASAMVVGVSFMVFQVSAQKATGGLGQAGDRARNFSMLAMAYSVSGFLGPLLAGFTIDHAGYRLTFVLLALIPVFTTWYLQHRALAVAMRDQEQPRERAPGGVADILRSRTLRGVLALNLLYSGSWDLHTIFIPIYGAKVGLSASAIGAVLATFAAATFLVRLCMPALLRWRTEHQVLTIALFVSGAAYLVMPFAPNAYVLASMSFMLGLGLGSGQPMIMALLHTHAPPGRIGEAVGVRMSLVQGSAVIVPLVFGALGTTFGIAPLFWSVGVVLTGGGLLWRRR